MYANILLSLLVCSNIYGTRRLKVVDGEHRAIPYASVRMDSNLLLYTDSCGMFTVPDGCYKARISHICYNDTSIEISEMRNDIIVMSPRYVKLPDLYVTGQLHKKKYSRIRVGYTDCKTSVSQGGRTGYVLAVFIPCDSVCNDKYIHAITADLYYDNVAVKGGNIHNAILRFDIRRAVSLQQCPYPDDKSLISGGIIYKGKRKSGKKIMQLPSPILFPKEGVFFVVEWVYPHLLPENDFLDVHVRTTFDDSVSRTLVKDPLQTNSQWVYLDSYKKEKALMYKYFGGNKRNAKLGLIVNK